MEYFKTIAVNCEVQFFTDFLVTKKITSLNQFVFKENKNKGMEEMVFKRENDKC